MDLDLVDIDSELLKDQSDDFLLRYFSIFQFIPNFMFLMVFFFKIIFSSSSNTQDDEINAILNQWKRNDDNRGEFITFNNEFDIRLNK